MEKLKMFRRTYYSNDGTMKITETIKTYGFKVICYTEETTDDNIEFYKDIISEKQAKEYLMDDTWNEVNILGNYAVEKFGFDFINTQTRLILIKLNFKLYKKRVACNMIFST